MNTKIEFLYEKHKGRAVHISGYQGSDQTITIPSEIDGYAVTGIEDGAFIFCNPFTCIVIPDSVTYIGYDAFIECSELTDIQVSKDNPKYASFEGCLFNKNMSSIIKCPLKKKALW